MIRICPKCNYARKESDTAPEWQCPSCEVAYSKAGVAAPSIVYSQPPAKMSNLDAPRFSAVKWILAAALVAAGIWVAKPFEKLGKSGTVTAAPGIGPEVVLYSTEWCGYCAAAREFLVQNDIPYTEMDIEKTTAGYEQHKRLGGRGVPLLVIEDEVIHGYSERSMRRTLQPWLKGS